MRLTLVRPQQTASTDSTPLRFEIRVGQNGSVQTCAHPQFGVLPRHHRIGGLGLETHLRFKCRWVSAAFQGLTFRTSNAKVGEFDFASNANSIGQTHSLYLLRQCPTAGQPGNPLLYVPSQALPFILAAPFLSSIEKPPVGGSCYPSNDSHF